jgi:hypothetical protein
MAKRDLHALAKRPPVMCYAQFMQRAFPHGHIDAIALIACAAAAVERCRFAGWLAEVRATACLRPLFWRHWPSVSAAHAILVGAPATGEWANRATAMNALQYAIACAQFAEIRHRRRFQ